MEVVFEAADQHGVALPTKGRAGDNLIWVSVKMQSMCTVGLGAPRRTQVLDFPDRRRP